MTTNAAPYVKHTNQRREPFHSTHCICVNCEKDKADEKRMRGSVPSDIASVADMDQHVPEVMNPQSNGEYDAPRYEPVHRLVPIQTEDPELGTIGAVLYILEHSGLASVPKERVVRYIAQRYGVAP